MSTTPIETHDVTWDKFGEASPPEPPLENSVPWQQRVIEEKNELDIKRVKLEEFMGSVAWIPLPDGEKMRLHRQHDAMNQYSSILAARIAAFPVLHDRTCATPTPPPDATPEMHLEGSVPAQCESGDPCGEAAEAGSSHRPFGQASGITRGEMPLQFPPTEEIEPHGAS